MTFCVKRINPSLS